MGVIGDRFRGPSPLIQGYLNYLGTLVRVAQHRLHILGFARARAARKSVRFRKLLLFVVLAAASSLFYLNLAFTDMNYLNIPLVYNTEDVTGVTKLPESSRKLIANSKLSMGPEDTRSDTLSAFSKMAAGITATSEFDPRLMPALVMAKMATMLETEQLDPENFQIAFSWNDWLDLDAKLKASHKWYNYFGRKDFTCDSFKKYYKITEELGKCMPLNEDQVEPGFPQFKFRGWIDASLPQEARAIMGASYLKFMATPPDRLIFLGADTENGGALIIPTVRDPKSWIPKLATRNQSTIESLDFVQFESSFHGLPREHIINRGISVVEETERFTKALQNVTLDFSTQRDDFDIGKDVVRIVNHELQDTGKLVHIPKDEFLWDTKTAIGEMKHRMALTNDKKNIQHLDYRLAKSVMELATKAPNFAKHFHESAIIGRPVAGAHYDWRFFNRLDIPYYEHVAVLHRMIRAWLRFSRVAGVNTWIAHGTLLSWWWNGLNMPWDTDADVQVTATSLYKLARNYHSSLVTDLTVNGNDDSFKDAGNVGIGKFYIDVGPTFFSREKGNGANAIDARFIDTQTGLYIDITALGFTDFYNNPDLVEKRYDEFLQVLDPEYLEKKEDPTVDLEAYTQELSKLKQKAFDDKEIYNCRNNHHYSYDELRTLIPTLYEGVKAYIPKGYTNMLKREYPKGFTRFSFWGHTYRPHLRLWVKSDVCPRDKEGDHCDDRVTLSEYKQTHQYTALHMEELETISKGEFVTYTRKDEFPPLRIDPWFIRHIKRTLGFASPVDYDNAA